MYKDNSIYDAIIIGAGIGGLVCGCYLARAGMKVLIAEQHFKPGGYCTSFKRESYTFDAAAHSFGGYRQDGIVRKVFDELGVDRKIKIHRYDPSDVINTPEFKVSFWSDVDKTIKDFQAAFPNESNNIEDFMYFLINPDPNSFARMRNWTFKDLLDKHFRDEKLKTVISYPLFGNGALPPTLMSALIGAKIFREFLLDGGYYPGSSMQALPDALGKIFKEFGGDLRLSCRIKKIRVKEKKVTGVISDRDGFIQSKVVISNCDSRQTFLKLLGREQINNADFLDMISKMIPSLSIFVLYLGVNKSFPVAQPGVNIWLLSDFDVSNDGPAKKGLNLDRACTMVRVMPSQNTLLAFVNVPYKNKAYWNAHKEDFSESFIERIEQYCMPGLSNHIVYKEAATPLTLHRYTLNYKGAAYGWACTPSQLGILDFRRPSFIQGLHLTGHWTTQGLGIPGVVYIGHETAKSILRKGQGRKPEMC